MNLYISDMHFGHKNNELHPLAQVKMEQCANFLVRMINKYGKEVLAEIEAEEKAKA